jgi:DNA repair protein RecN (Recombination protein N)
MLEELTVRNYALIDSLELSFSEGLNILSGETGAGKSIVVGALGLVLGDRADSGVIRSGEEETEVTCLLRIRENEDALRWLAEREIEPDDERVLLRRTLKTGGKGSSYIQSTRVTRKDLEDFTSFLIDMHGQHEHQSLLSIDKHRMLLDQYAGNEELAASLYRDFYSLNRLKQELEEMQKTERELLREKELLEFAVKEIEAAELNPEEESELEQERRILNQHEKLFDLFHMTDESLSESGGGALGSLREARRGIEQIAEIMPVLDGHRERLENAFYEIEDILETLKDKQEELRFSPDRLEEVEDRLQQIHRLEKKYGNTIEEVLAYREEALVKLNSVENREERREELKKNIRELEEKVFRQARELSAKRKSAAVELKKKIEAVLHTLGMQNSIFEISTGYREGKNGKASCGPHGFDRIEFLISPNRGEPLKPLREIASGGEMSRIMLAVKTVFVESDRIGSLIFDEIDTGIGGEVALAVGEHLAKLGRHKQILCITHLASIAVRADTHLKVSKFEQDGRTLTAVNTVKGEARVEEIARMLSGDTENEASRRHALELLEKFRPRP